MPATSAAGTPTVQVSSSSCCFLVSRIITYSCALITILVMLVVTGKWGFTLTSCILEFMFPDADGYAMGDCGHPNSVGDAVTRSILMFVFSFVLLWLVILFVVVWSSRGSTDPSSESAADGTHSGHKVLQRWRDGFSAFKLLLTLRHNNNR